MVYINRMEKIMIKGSKKEDIQIINAGCTSISEDGIWFVHYVLPILMFYDFKLNYVSKAKLLPCEKIEHPFGLFGAVETVGSKVFVFPRRVKECYVYDIDTDNLRKLEVKNVLEYGYYTNSYIYRENIYVMPFKNNNILKINPKTEEITYLMGLSEVSAIDDNARMGLNRVVNIALEADSLYVFNLKNETWGEIGLQGNEYKLGSVDYYNNIIYVYDVNCKKVLAISEEGQILKKSKSFSLAGAKIFHTIDGGIILNSNYSGEIFILNKDLEVENVINTEPYKSPLVSPYLAGSWNEYNEKIYGILKSNELIVIDGNKIERHSLYMKKSAWNALAKDYVSLQIKNKEKIAENEVCSLINFLDSIKKY